MKKSLLLVLFFVLIASNSFAYVNSGSDILNACESEENYFAQGQCLGFITGVLDSTNYIFQTLIKDDDSYRHPICIPENVTVGQLEKVILKFLSEHPSDLHLPATALVISSYIDAFPCE